MRPPQPGGVAKPVPPLAAPQPKAAARTTQAPPAYRPQPTPKVLQKKAVGNPPAAGLRARGPVPPPAYRPQPTPKVLQRKVVGAAPSPPASSRPPSAVAQLASRPGQRTAQHLTAVAAQALKRPPTPRAGGGPGGLLPFAAGRANAVPPGHRAGVVQRLILVPFDHADQSLINFANQGATGLAPGPVLIGTTLPQKIRVDEDLVLIGHGNGTQFYSHPNSTDQGFKQYEFSSLAKFLSKKVLPDNYAGKITVWACDSARPWKHISALAEQYEEDDDAEEILSNSFIKQLENHLESAGKGYHPTIVGAIGYATLDRPWAQAEVYADEHLKYVGNKAGFQQGFVGTGATVDDSFYDLDDSEGEDFVSSSDEASHSSSESSSDMEAEVNVPAQRPQVPTFQSKREYLDYLASLTPYGSTSRPPTLKQRLGKK